MNAKCLFFSLILLCSCSSKSTINKDVNDNSKEETHVEKTVGNVKILSVVIDTLALSNAYNALVKNPNDRKCQEDFFNAYPRNWFEYISTYGYPEGKMSPRNDVQYGQGHMNAFANLNLINDTLYCSKLIDISIGAYIDADAPNELKCLLGNMMHKKSSLMMELISSMLDSDQMLFWGFYWVSLHRDSHSQEELERIIATHGKDYPDEMKIVKTTYEYFCGKSIFASFPESHIGLKNSEGCSCMEE